VSRDQVAARALPMAEAVNDPSRRRRSWSSFAPPARGLATARVARGLEWCAALALAALVAFNLSVVRGSSMAPGIRDGDRIVVDHLSYLLSDVQRGDIVVLEYPLDPSLDYIKRVVGLPGDDVLVDGRGVRVNGALLDEPYACALDPRTSLRTTVPPGAYFVLGDNRPHSSDSREFGLVPRENIVGKVDLCIWPPARAGLLD